MLTMKTSYISHVLLLKLKCVSRDRNMKGTSLSNTKTLHAQKFVDIATGSGSKTNLRPLWLHSQMNFTTVRPSDNNRDLKQTRTGSQKKAFIL